MSMKRKKKKNIATGNRCNAPLKGFPGNPICRSNDINGSEQCHAPSVSRIIRDGIILKYYV